MNDYNKKLIDEILKRTADEHKIKRLLMLMNDLNFDKWLEDEWISAERDIDNKVGYKMFDEIMQQSIKIKIKKFQKIFNVAACFTIGILCSLVFYLNKKEEPINILIEKEVVVADTRVSAGKGQKAKVVLPDGTNVWLNSDSELTYGSHFNATERNVYLKGQAYFEVAENKDAPFVVNTSHILVKALGTTFDIKAYPDDNSQTAVLTDGKAEVATNTGKLVLTPNQRIDFNKSDSSLLKTDITEGSEFSLWKNNVLFFHNQSLLDIVNTLSRQYNIEFVFKNEKVKNYRFSGTIDNTSLTSLLQIFSLTSPLLYEIKDTAIFLNESKNAAKYFEKITTQN